MNVQIHIEKLVLYGFESVNRARLDAALRAELTRLLADGGTPGALGTTGHRPVLDAGPIRAAPDASPEMLGAQIAQAIHGGLGR